MGSQQLLIITLILFVVGLAILTGVRMTTSYNQAHERDQIMQQLNVLVGEARKYAAKPKSLGGGEGSFEGFVPAAGFTVTDRLRIYVNSGEDWVIFQGFGSVEGYDGETPVQVVAQYDKTLQNWSSITNVN